MFKSSLYKGVKIHFRSFTKQNVVVPGKYDVFDGWQKKYDLWQNSKEHGLLSHHRTSVSFPGCW